MIYPFSNYLFFWPLCVRSIPLTRDRTHDALGVCSLSHWTAREVLPITNLFFFFFPKELITELAKNLYGSPHKIRYHSLVVACLSMNLLQCYPLPGLVGRMLGTLSSLIPVPPGEGFSSHKGRVYLDFLSL